MRAALRRWVVALIVIWLLPTLLAVASPFSPVAEAALSRIGNRWIVTPGSAAEIQQAIDAARSVGGGRVHLPAGVYLLTSKVRLHDNVYVYGDGIDQTILRWAPGANVDNMMSNGSVSDGNTNLQVWGLTLDGQNRPGNGGDCCVGLRLNNVKHSTFVNVAADRHSLDGIYIGYNHDDGVVNGAINVRVSGCRATQNGRNGIALIHGDGNIVDGCQVNNNNRSEAVAGIDLEPDEGLSVTNSRIVNNTANGQNVGIQIFLPFNGYATTFHNAVCYNTTTGQRQRRGLLPSGRPEHLRREQYQRQRHELSGRRQLADRPGLCKLVHLGSAAASPVDVGHAVGSAVLFAATNDLGDSPAGHAGPAQRQCHGHASSLRAEQLDLSATVRPCAERHRRDQRSIADLVATSRRTRRRERSRWRSWCVVRPPTRRVRPCRSR